MDFIFQLLFYLENREVFAFSGFVLMISYILVMGLFFLLMMKNKILIPKGLAWFLFLILAINIFGWLNGTATISELAKQSFGISFFSITIFSFFSFKRYDVIKIAQFYVKAAFILSIIAIIQEVILILFPSTYLPFFRLVNHNVMGSFSRVSSLFLEPAHFAFFLAPAVFLCFETLLNGNNALLTRNKILIIIIAFILTFSSSGFVVFFLMPFFFFKPKHLVFYSVLIVGLVLIVNNVELFKVRFEDTRNIFSGSADISRVNLSTFALASNFETAKVNFFNNPIFGGGFGSHEKQYMSMFKNLPWGNMALNYNDAGSLFLRIMSELGLFGLLFFLFFILRFKIKNRKASRELRIINSMALMIFAVALLRNGHFFNYAFWVFIASYYYSYKIASNQISISIQEPHPKIAELK